MGNFLWGSGLLTPEDWHGGELRLTLRGRTVIKRTFIPAELSGETRQPIETTGAEAETSVPA
jgi:hypothetical protein